jgi:hypothetical protein
MRKLISFIIVALGATVGLVSAAADDGSTRLVMMAIGVLFAAPFAGAVLFVGRKAKGTSGLAGNPAVLTGDGVSAEDLAANYWRDKGHGPLMKPVEGHPDTRQFDPDRIA